MKLLDIDNPQGLNLRLICFLYGTAMLFIGGMGVQLAKALVFSASIAIIGFLLLYVATFYPHRTQAPGQRGEG